MKDFLILILVVVGFIAIIVAMIKSKQIGLLCGFLILAWGGLACYSCITAGIYYSTKSGTTGELVEHDPYEDFDYYKYNITDFALEQAEDGSFFYEKTYATSIEFDGTDKNYTLLMNNKPCEDTQSQYGKLTAYTIIHFDEVDGSYKDGIKLTFNFTFRSSNIILRIDTTATQYNASLLNEYVAINGFELRIIEDIFPDSPVLSDNAG